MLKIIIITLMFHLMGFASLPNDITTNDMVNVEHITFYEQGISIEYNEDYCINNNLDYRGYWIEENK